MKFTLTELFVSAANAQRPVISLLACGQTGSTASMHSDIYLTTLFDLRIKQRKRQTRVWVSGGGGGELCRPVVQRESREQKKCRICWSVADTPGLLRRIHAHPHMHEDSHKCTFTHSSIKILDLSAHVCGLIRASSDRKQGVSQGEIFVMEIWTAGVGKQS